MGARGIKERLPGPALIKVICYSAGSHGRNEFSAGNPLRGDASWSIVDVYEDDLEEFQKFVGKPAQIWTGDAWGSYHERSITVFLIAPGLHAGFTPEAKNIKFEGEFPFRSIKNSCRELMDRMGIAQPPYSEDFPKLDVEEPSEVLPGKEAPRIDVETPDKPKKGESSQQYWDRLRDEKIGKYHYRHKGD